ncbi:MAG TPA: Arc family DNA-binding protein [Ktedonobacterales bacterium]
MNTERDETRITIRFPRQVADAIKRLATDNDRSINSEVVRAVREYITRQGRKRDV